MMEKRVCEECGKVFDRNEMCFTRDCHGLEFRLVCWNCYDSIMANGYDGEYYDESDECLDDLEGW